MNRFSVRRALLALALTATAFAAPAQGDKQPIHLLVGFAPGGAADTLARLLADKLREPLGGQQIIVDNKPGIGGRLAAMALKNAAPDGLTYMVAPNATLVFQALEYPVSVLHYDMATDFTSVAQVVSYPMAMVVNASTGVANAREYVAWVKAHPEQANFGTAGLGGDTHFNGLQFAKVAGIKMNPVPYRGNGPLVTDLLGGQILAANLVAGDALQHVKAGKLRYIGVYAPARSPLLPDVPTMAEQGFDTGGSNGWMGLWAPAKLPKAELERMQAALQQVLAEPEVKEMMATRFAQVADYRSGAEVDRELQRELAHWGPVIKASGFSPQP
ncbi:MAG: ABC transporter substrate-binding protein [Burkholderiales bacterium]|nr:ABC transporter substrate-binding protein [Burkholderiales bacterium]MDE2396319.1 ABC transporter substrate-binding protein [Burkholderiales bacterium]MDE2454535.1 ABC transporter substrate-binding protein [Burkholderiales bacterium]